MKTLTSWRDLEEFGIDPLTGESCGYMLRLLCDVTAQGKRIIEKCLDCKLDLHDNWNGGSKSEPHVGSIMLAPHLFPPIAAFALMDAGYSEAWILKGGTVCGIPQNEEPEHIQTYRRMYQDQMKHILRNTSIPRNQHQMTGRVV